MVDYMAFMKKYVPNDTPLDAIGVSGYHNAQMVELRAAQCRQRAHPRERCQAGDDA